MISLVCLMLVRRSFVGLLSPLAFAAAVAGAQSAASPGEMVRSGDSGTTHATSPSTSDSVRGLLTVPFAPGETAQYDVKFGILHVGSASTTIAHTETLRGHQVWHTIFSVKGGTLFYHVNDVLESWIDQATFSSLRFYQTQEEGTKERRKRYEIYPDQGTYVEMDKHPPRTHPVAKDPLDDGSFLFFIRTLPLTVGKSYEWNRYFRPERNPVRLHVLRKETIRVPAGTFNCVVVQPTIKTTGIFSENGQALVWLTDDARHVVVQLKSRLSFGSINLYLRSYKPGT